MKTLGDARNDGTSVKYQVTLKFTVETTAECAKSLDEVAESLLDRALYGHHGMGYGANLFWELSDVKIVKNRWLLGHFMNNL